LNGLYLSGALGLSPEPDAAGADVERLPSVPEPTLEAGDVGELAELEPWGFQGLNGLDDPAAALGFVPPKALYEDSF
jgi:hypothetical protein